VTDREWIITYTICAVIILGWIVGMTHYVTNKAYKGESYEYIRN